nr:putative integrase [uncultured Mediterranean phage uvMED]
MKVGLARVSTQNKAQDTSIAAQEQALLNAGCDRVITVRESAFKGPRRGWHELRKLVASGTVKEVLCIDQSRLARDGSDLEFLEECAVQGVIVRALSGGVIETASVGGFVQAGVFSVMNQAYSRQLALKVKDGLDRRKASGHYGCGRVPFGYAYVDGKVVPDPEDWPVARQMFLDLLALEMNVCGYIRKHRSKWTPPGIKGWLHKPILRGIVANQKDGVKPLFSPEEWAKAERLLAHRSGSPSKSTTTVHLLTGLVTCEQCSKRLKHKVVRRGNQRLYCANSACSWYSRGVSVPVVRAQLVQVLTAKVWQMQEAVQQASVATDHEESAECIALRARIAQLEALRASGVPELDRSLETLNAELLAMQTPVIGPDWTGLAELVRVGLPDATDEELRPIVLEYVAQILYTGTPTEVSIRLRESPGSN